MDTTGQTTKSSRNQSTERMRKSLQELNLLDRFLFAEAADQAEFMELFLSIVFGKDIRLQHPPQTEKEIRSRKLQKQIRLDVWAVDQDQALYNAEPQKRNTYNLLKRSRYYQGLLDSSLLEPGDTRFQLLNDVYTLLLTPFDLFGYGLYRYTFCMECQEVPGLKLEDGAARLFLNTRGSNPKGVSPELIQLLRYMEHTTEAAAKQSGSPRIERLQEIVSAIRQSEEVGVKYMQAWEEKAYERQDGFEEGLAKGQLEGLEEGAFQTLASLVQEGLLTLEQAMQHLNGNSEAFQRWYQEQAHGTDA